MDKIMIADRLVGNGEPAYVIAEIGSNFDGSLERAKKLIDLAKDCGADCAKFQSFKASSIVSKVGFEGLKTGFQKKWDKPVYEIYKKAEFPREWTEELFEYCRKIKIHFLSAPYDKEAVDILDKIGVPAIKIGSGDITWHRHLRYIAKKEKPIILSTGASSLSDIDKAVRVLKEEGNNQIILLQCVTNYPSEFKSANLRAMKSMGETFDVLYGYSDHTPGSVVPLGSVALGGCIVEKHFTDDKTRMGPDHPFAMDGKDFKEMCTNIRNLEAAMGSPHKKVYDEENETILLQRRCLRAAKDLEKGDLINEDNIVELRPMTRESIQPFDFDKIVGKKVKRSIQKGYPLKWDDI
jgi:sialic acid synthase SpsE